ncbi:hypothetical protein ACFPRL_31560 [Pseudoclavibacter helvolus]
MVSPEAGDAHEERSPRPPCTPGEVSLAQLRSRDVRAASGHAATPSPPSRGSRR